MLLSTNCVSRPFGEECLLPHAMITANTGKNSTPASVRTYFARGGLSWYISFLTKPSFYQAGEPLAQYSRRDEEVFLEFVKLGQPLLQVAQDQQTPGVSYLFDGPGDGAKVGMAVFLHKTSIISGLQRNLNYF